MIPGNNAAQGRREPSVSAGFATALLAFAVARGADRDALLAASGIAASSLANQDNRVSLTRYMALMRAAKTACGDPALPLEFGAHTDFRTFSVVGLISHSAATMAEALVQMNRYGRLVAEVDGVSDGERFQIVSREDGLWMEDRRLNPDVFPEMTESTWSRFICGSRRDFPQLTFAFAAHVTHPAPAHAEAYARIWGVPVTFGSDRNAIRMNPLWPTLPIQPQARYMFGVLTDRADALLEELERGRTTRARVEASLMPILHTGDAGAQRIARSLGVSRQTLYRMLKAEGVTFERVLDELRHALSLQYLGGEKVSVNEVAYLVGFSDPAAFSRAFKRWTGVTPRAARARD